MIDVTRVLVQVHLASHPLREVATSHHGAMMTQGIFMATTGGDAGQPREVVKFRAAQGFQLNVGNLNLRRSIMPPLKSTGGRSGSCDVSTRSGRPLGRSRLSGTIRLGMDGTGVRGRVPYNNGWYDGLWRTDRAKGFGRDRSDFGRKLRKSRRFWFGKDHR